LIGSATRAKAAEDDVVLADRDTDLGFEGGRRRALHHAGHRDKLVAGAAVQMVVMRCHQLETGAAIVEQNFAERPFRHELFGGTEDRREIAGGATLGESALDVFKGPCVVLARFHQGEHRSGDPSFPTHPRPYISTV
jgi:hypothetical protein